MIAITVYLTGLALLDGLNPIILGLCALVATRASRSSSAWAFTGGVFVSSLLSALVMVFGLGALIAWMFERYEPAITALTVAMGVACIVFGYFAPRTFAKRSRRSLRRDTLAGIFLMGAFSNQTDIVTLTPFLTAMHIVMSSELGDIRVLAVLLWYNVVLILPLVLLTFWIRHRHAGRREAEENVHRWTRRYAPETIRVLSMVLGAAIVWYGLTR